MRSMIALLGALLAMTIGCVTPRQRTTSPATPRLLAVLPRISVQYPESWTESGIKYRNAHELVRLPQAQTAQGPLVRMLITTEQRLSRSDARQRLVDVARSRSASPSFYSIGGWPAVEIRFKEPLPELGDSEGEARPGSRPVVQRALMAIAFDQQIVDFDIWLAPGVPDALLEEAVGIARSARFPDREDPDELRGVLDGLKQSAQQGARQPEPAGTAATSAVRNFFSPSPLSPVLLPKSSRGELEITSSDDARRIVIASNSLLNFSADGGATFNNGNTPAPVSDPTVARSVSDNFYLGSIGRPTGQLGVGGCSNWISRSTDGGANFTFTGFSASCPFLAASLCFPDQPHIAADAFNTAPAGTDQVYAVWRLATPSGTAANCSAVGQNLGSVTPVIACSSDNGVTWSAPVALPGGGDHPRVAVGVDGKVYAVALSGNSVLLTRFTSCAQGLLADAGFPVTVTDASNFVCPVPGLDRCDDTALNSPTVAPDPLDPTHLYVTYAQSVDNYERIVSRESKDSGLTFPGEFILSPPTAARRFMPWSCSAKGSVFVGWYDRQAALGGPVPPIRTNDLTDYFLGSPMFAQTINLSGQPDPQCASGWLSSAPRSQDDSESCTVQPQLAGRCLNSSGKGSGSLCDFSDNVCPAPGESCTTGAGQPKYGDYNGIACAENQVITAWTSATAPTGLPPVPGLSIFSRVVPLQPNASLSWDQLQIDITTGEDDARDSSEIYASVLNETNLLCLKPSKSLAPDGICSNGDGATDQTGKNSWHSADGVISQTFTVATPKTSPAGFGPITITLVQGPCLGCTSDNWNLEAIKVTAVDSSGRSPSRVLLDLSSGSPKVDDTTCIARLKDSPNAAAVEFSLDSPPTSTHLYRGGAADGTTTTCKNNGD